VQFNFAEIISAIWLVSPFLQATKALRESRGIALLSALEGVEGSIATTPFKIFCISAFCVLFLWVWNVV
jgi:hypothetical protein